MIYLYNSQTLQLECYDKEETLSHLTNHAYVLRSAGGASLARAASSATCSLSMGLTSAVTSAARLSLASRPSTGTSRSSMEYMDYQHQAAKVTSGNSYTMLDTCLC